MFKFLYPINFKFIMENNYFNLRPKSLPDALSLRRWFCLILLSVSFILTGESAFAQKVPVDCGPGSRIPATIFGEDASAKDVADAKIRVSGLPANDYRVGYSVGGTYTGPAFAAATKWSDLTNGYISQTLATPAAAPGDLYTIRIYKSDTTCFTDIVYTLPYVNFNFKPKYVDIQVVVTKTPAGDVPLDTEVKVLIAVKNSGEIKATGVEVTVAAALTGLQFVSDNGTGAYVNGTGIWNIGEIPEGTTKSLEITYKVTARGIREVKAWNSKLNEIDANSSPTQNTILEDDQGQVCISTPYDYCKGDEYEYVLTGAPTNIQWSKNGSPISGKTADFEVSSDGKTLIIKSLGNYTYTAQYNASCPATGCCPITIEAGLPPILTAPGEQVICFNAAFASVTATNTQTGPFKSDQGVFTYQWYNNNGIGNPNTTAIAGQTTLDLASTVLPTAPGVYNYRVISVQTGHTNCADTADVSLIINELPSIVASINSPVCAEDTIELDVTATATSGGTAPVFVYAWAGPSSYTSSVEDPRILNATMAMAGDYTVTVSYTANTKTCDATKTLPLVVNPLPAPPTPVDLTYCAEDKPERLSANGTGTSLHWYGPTGQTPLPVYGSKPDTVTNVGLNVGPRPYLGAPGDTYYHISQVDANGCESHTAMLSIKILTKPTKPTVEDLAYCQGYPSSALTAIMASPSGYALHWYGTDPAGTATVGATYPAPPTGTVGTTSYYVSQKTTGAVKDCESDIAKIDVIVKATPNAPAVTPPDPYCVDAVAAPLVATADAGNTLIWYWNGGTQATAPTPTTTQSGGTWAYVSQTLVYTNPIPGKTGTLTCESGQAAIPILVNPLPVATMIPISAICIGAEPQNNAQLVLTRYRDSDQVSWTLGSTYASGTPTGFNSPAAGGVFASSLANPKPAGAQQDYTVRIKNTFGCTIDRTLPLVAKDCTCPGGYCEPATITKTK